MAITGLSTDLNIVGPFQSSAGDYYIFGKDSGTATTLQCFKATSDPDTSWASIATNTGFSTAILGCRGRQIGDIIHLAIADGTSTSTNYKYRTFDMSSDSFVISETIVSGQDTRADNGNPSYVCFVEMRSSTEVVAVFAGQRKKYDNVWYPHAYYSRRTAPNTWTTKTEIYDAAGPASFVTVIDADDNIILIGPIGYYNGGKIITASNTIADSIGVIGSGETPYAAVVYTNSDNQQQIGFVTSTGKWWRFISGDTGSASSAVIESLTVPVIRPYVDTTGATPTLCAVYRANGTPYKLAAKKSTDNGATWSAAEIIASDSTDYYMFSYDSPVYLRSDDYKASVVLLNAAAATVHKGHVVRSKRVNVQLSSANASAAVAGVSKSVAKGAVPAIATGVAPGQPQIATVGLTKVSAASEKGSLTVEGATVSVSLQGVSFAPSVGGFGLALETEGGSARLSLTRLGPGGYPIATLPGGPAAPVTSVYLFSTSSIAGSGTFAGYEYIVGLSSATSAATATVPIWKNSRSIAGATASARAASIGSALQFPELPSIASAANFGDLIPSNGLRLIDLAVAAAADNFNIEELLTLEGSITTAAFGEFAPYIFTGTSVVLDSIAAQGVAAGVVFAEDIVLPEAVAHAANNIITMEGDEAFSLAAAAASGTVGDLLVAIVIPAAIKWLVCASIDIVPEVAGDLAMNAELQATIIAAAALQGSPLIAAAVDGTVEIAPIVSGSPSMKEC